MYFIGTRDEPRITLLGQESDMQPVPTTNWPTRSGAIDAPPPPAMLTPD